MKLTVNLKVRSRVEVEVLLNMEEPIALLRAEESLQFERHVVKFSG